MFIPVNGYGLSVGGQRRATGREKPKQFGPLSYVQYCVARNAERLGIDPANIAGYWPMWEGAGGRAWDVSLHGNHGILNGPTWVNRGLDFDERDYAEVEGYKGVLGTSAVATSLWFKTSSSNIQGFLRWGYLNDAGGSFRLVIDEGDIRLLTWGDRVAKWAGNFDDNKWHHQILTHPENANLSDVDVYIDNKKLDRTDLSNDGPLDYQSDGDVFIGRIPKHSFKGKIGGARICNCTITPDQIAFDYSHPYALLQPIPRPIFFDVGAIDAKGRLTVTFDSKSPDISFESKTPSITFDGKGPRVTFK